MGDKNGFRQNSDLIEKTDIAAKYKENALKFKKFILFTTAIFRLHYL